MPNLEGLGLQNFRTFTKKENIEFAPITLITGTNNAGKSTIFKAIQFLVDNFKDGIVSETLDFNTMRHELGNLERIVNRVSMTAFKNSEIPDQSMQSRLSDLHRKNNGQPIVLPIFEADEDLVFAFPIKFGNSREISASLEVRYGLTRWVPKNEGKGEVSVSHHIKNIAIVKDEGYLHWTNIIGLRSNHEEADDWEMVTSLDLKKIIQLIRDTPLEVEDKFEPNDKTDDYFTVDLFSRIEKYKKAFFDLPFFKTKNDGYEGFTEKFIEGESLFSDYSRLTEKEKSKLSAIEQTVLNGLLQGKDNSQYKILDCFRDNFSHPMDGMENDIVRAELKAAIPEEKQESSEEKNIRELIKPTRFQTTANSTLFTNLLGAIEKDLLATVQQKIDSLKNVYFLPTTRGRNREWFIDEQNTEDTQIARDFSAIYLDHHEQIQKFVNFWIGKGEIMDDNGKKKLKGFNIGKALSVFRDEAIGLTKIFLVNFDGTKTPLVDLGYGVSQLLPIIMKIAIIAREHQRTHQYDFNSQEGYHESEAIYFSASTLLIEEPEANLHPSLQSKMAELVIDAASRFNIQFLIETHSEYLIYKIQQYIGWKIVDPGAVKMYYFNHPSDVRDGLKDQYINQVEIAKDGSIDYDRYFGKGFFDEQTDLKLSLLNIQRGRFIEDYEAVEEKLKNANQAIAGHDARIAELDQELLTATSGINELEEQLNETKREKAENELALQQLIEQRDEIIDDYTAKVNYSNYEAEMETIIDSSKIDHSKTLKYLSTGKFLLANLDNAADFAPVVIQYGRAVEFEMIKWVNDFKNSLSVPDKNAWSEDTNYRDKLNDIFSNLSIVKPSHQTIGFDLGTVNERKISFYHLKTFTNNTSTDYKFGELTQIFELFYDISPAKNLTYNYSSVPLMAAFSDYLKGIWRDYDTAEGLFNTCRNILDMRNCAGHTYSGSIDKPTAQSYAAKVEAIFSCL